MTDLAIRILLVDDEKPIRTVLSQILSRAGCSVRSSSGALEALAELENEVPDLLLSDLNMPGMSGFELLSFVRLRFPEIHVIAMSGTCFGDSVPHGVCADAFYEKGRGVGVLMEKVAAVAHSSRSSQYVRVDNSRRVESALRADSANVFRSSN
jgi:CheY-like chemotaxis protein